jgi:hypothetical protein
MTQMIVMRNPAFVSGGDPARAKLTRTGVTQARELTSNVAAIVPLDTWPLIIHSVAQPTKSLAWHLAREFRAPRQQVAWLTHGPMNDLDLISPPISTHSSGYVLACAQEPCIRTMFELAGMTPPAAIKLASAYRFSLNRHSGNLTFIRQIA